jgi:hypothetical protein
MKSAIRTIAFAALVSVAFVAPALHAQDRPIARVNVPFSFDYGMAHFAPGVYTLIMTSPDILLIRNNAGAGIHVVQTAWGRAQANGGSRVVFNEYGDRYFLEQVMISGSGIRIIVPESNAEKHATRELVLRGAPANQVAVAFLPGPTPGN